MKIFLTIIAVMIACVPAYAGKKKSSQKTATHAQVMDYYHRMCGNTEDVEMYIGTTAQEVKRTCRKISYYIYLNNKAAKKARTVRKKQTNYRKKRQHRK